VRRFLSKYFGYPIKDLYTRAPILKTKDFLDTSQYWDKDKIEKYRLEKLKSLVKHAYENVPFYTERFNKIGLRPKDITSLEDIKKIPVLTKNDVRNNFDLLLDNNWKNTIFFEIKTGGTTGPPLLVLKDIRAYAFEWGSFYRWFNWIGISLGDPIATFWGSPNVLSSDFKQKSIKRISNLLTNQIFFNSFELSEQKLPGVIKRLNSYKPRLIKGYLSAILQVANYLAKSDLKLNFRPIAISTTSETLFLHQKEFIQNIFGCPVFDQYGCTEVTAVSYECSKQNGQHINQEHVIVEVLSEDYKENLSSGRLLLTDLDCRIMPFIRYENGDYVTLSENECTCGVKHPMIHSVDGRIAQTIQLKDGSQVHGVFFTDILYELPGRGIGIIKFQVYQKIPGEIEFRYESNMDLSEDFKIQLEKAFLRFFNNIKLARFEKIPSGPSGKHIYLLREV
jgi:phenylacetate-CoA ligase